MTDMHSFNRCPSFTAGGRYVMKVRRIRAIVLCCLGCCAAFVIRESSSQPKSGTFACSQLIAGGRHRKQIAPASFQCGRVAIHRRSKSDANGPTPTDSMDNQQDIFAEILKELTRGTNGIGGSQDAASALPNMFAGLPLQGDFGDFRTPDSALPGGLMGGIFGSTPQKKPSDSFFTDRLPILQKLKRPFLLALFAYFFWRGWIGRWGLIQGAMSQSYFNAFAVPLRVLPQSPVQGKAYFVCQFWVDSAIRALGWLVNFARGKAKIPSWPPSPDGWPGGEVGNFSVPPQSQTMPTARTAATSRSESVAARSQSMPVVDAEVTFLD